MLLAVGLVAWAWIWWRTRSVRKGEGEVIEGEYRSETRVERLDPATLEPFDDQWAYLSSIARLSHKDVATLARTLPDPQFGHRVRRLRNARLEVRPSDATAAFDACRDSGGNASF